MPSVHSFRIEQSDLEKLSEDELAILFVGGRILNDLNLAAKQLKFATNAVKAHPDGPDRTAAFTALSFAIRVQSGYMNEAYEFWEDNVRIDLMLKANPDHFDGEFNAGLKEVRSYFGKRNYINPIRNRMSFHYDRDLMLQTYRAIPNGFYYDMLIGAQHQGHNVFYGSEMLVISAVRHLKENVTWDEAIDAVVGEVTGIVIPLGRMFQRVIGFLMSVRMGIVTQDAEEIEIAAGPASDTVLVPYFCSPPANRGPDGERL